MKFRRLYYVNGEEDRRPWYGLMCEECIPKNREQIRRWIKNDNRNQSDPNWLVVAEWRPVVADKDKFMECHACGKYQGTYPEYDEYDDDDELVVDPGYFEAPIPVDDPNGPRYYRETPEELVEKKKQKIPRFMTRNGADVVEWEPGLIEFNPN